MRFGGEIYDWAPEATSTPASRSGSTASPSSPSSPASTRSRTRASTSPKEDSYVCGAIIGSGIGGLNEIEEQERRLILKGPDRVSAFTIPKLMLNAASGHLSIRFGLRGPNYAVATACASATNAMGDAYKAIQYGDADVMLTGGAEAALTPIGLSGFSNMKALSERNDNPAAASRPFDADRDGFVLSEGAGIAGVRGAGARPEARRQDLRRGPRLRRERRRRPHHAARRARHRRRPRDERAPCATRSSSPKRSTTSTPTARARRWATRPRRSP